MLCRGTFSLEVFSYQLIYRLINGHPLSELRGVFSNHSNEQLMGFVTYLYGLSHVEIFSQEIGNRLT